MTKIEKLPNARPDDDDDDVVIQPERSEVAQAVARLKEASFKTASEREHLPQPLFWSLFSEQLKSIKKRKMTQRVLSSVFGSSEEP